METCFIVEIVCCIIFVPSQVKREETRDEVSISPVSCPGCVVTEPNHTRNVINAIVMKDGHENHNFVGSAPDVL